MTVADRPLRFLFERWSAAADQPAVVHDGTVVTYGALADAVVRWSAELRDAGVAPGDVCAITAEFGLEPVAALLAAIDASTTVVPLSPTLGERTESVRAIAAVQWNVDPDAAAGARVTRRSDATAAGPRHALLDEVARRGHPGLILFSSGSTGESK
ncbi:MAG: AMP-binding protein, partial [Acidimicrobiales bacterium]|nr:AMP-binding protein [Acidimicrobiales bacterium]